MAIIIEPIELPKRGSLSIQLDVEATINHEAEEARRKVTVFVGDRIADLLSGETPSLVWQPHGVYWRVPVALHSRSMGRIGIVGTIEVNVETGELQLTDQLIEDIEKNAQRFAIGASL